MGVTASPVIECDRTHHESNVTGDEARTDLAQITPLRAFLSLPVRHPVVASEVRRGVLHTQERHRMIGAGHRLPHQRGSLNAGTLRPYMQELTLRELGELFRTFPEVAGTLGRGLGEHEILQQTAVLRHANPSDACREPRVSA
jgi:hypothetical protein